MCMFWGEHFEFKDSFQFLSGSLAALVDNLKSENNLDRFRHLKNSFPQEEVSLLLRKGVYPYEYMTSFEKFQEQRLPPLKPLPVH